MPFCPADSTLILSQPLFELALPCQGGNASAHSLWRTLSPLSQGTLWTMQFILPWLQKLCHHLHLSIYLFLIPSYIYMLCFSSQFLQRLVLPLFIVLYPIPYIRPGFSNKLYFQERVKGWPLRIHPLRASVRPL